MRRECLKIGSGRWKWLLLGNAIGAAAVREWYKRNRTVQIVPVGMFESRAVPDLKRGEAPGPAPKIPL